MVVQPLRNMCSTQICIEVEVEEEAVLVAIQEIKTNNNNRKMSLESVSCYSTTTPRMQVRRYVVFDEMS